MFLCKRCVLLVLFATFELHGQQFSLQFSQNDLHFKRVGDYDLILLSESALTNEIGKPTLPQKTINIAIPSNYKVIGVEIISTTRETLKGEFRLLPSQPPRHTDESLSEITPPDPSLYFSDSIYPGNLIKIVGQGDIAGQRLVAVNVYPLQYLPTEKRVILFENIVFSLKLAPASNSPRSTKLTNLSRRIYYDLLKDMVINPNDIKIPNRGKREGSTLLTPGDYDYVIITTTNFESYWEQLLNWKKKKGLRDTVITTSWIYSNYSGSDNQEKIRNFITDANSTWGTIWFLLGGDAEYIPMKTKTFYVDTYYDVPSDYYYADYDDDWYQEVFVGRASVESYTQINTFINKVYNYETDPPTSNFPLNILLIGMDLDNSTQSEIMKEDIDNLYIPSRFNVTKVYDSYSGNHKTNVINALNSGQNLVNHSDHSNSDVIGVGYTNHGLYLSTSDVDALTNTNKTCVFYSLGCWSNAFDSNDAISEHFVVYNPDRAAVAYIGNTRYGWYNQGYYNTLSMFMDREWWKSLFSLNKYHVGEALADSKNRNFPSGGTMQYIHYELCLIGDPEMPIWTNTPGILTVSHPDTIVQGTQNFTVTVHSGSSPVVSALTCLWKGDEVYETGYTNSSGQVTFTIDPTSEGTLYVTVTKQNYIPYQGSTFVLSGPPQAQFAAEPTTGVVPLDVQFTDQSSGYITFWHWLFGDGGESFEQNPSHTYLEEGTFDVTLTVGGPSGFDTLTRYDYITINCDNAMYPESTTATYGASGVFKIYGRTNVKTLAFQMGMCFDPTKIQIDSLSWRGTVLDTAWGGGGPDYFGPYIDNNSGNWQVAVIYSFSTPPNKSLNPLNDEPILSVFFSMADSASPNDTIPLLLSDDCGTNIFTDTTQSSVYPCKLQGQLVFTPEPLFIRGDANATGEVNINDVVYLLNHLFPSPNFTCNDASDCNDDGILNINDASYLLDHLFPSPSLPEPCPDCGLDPTFDTLGCTGFTPCGSGIASMGDTVNQNILTYSYENEDGAHKLTLNLINSTEIAAFQIEISLPQNFHSMGLQFSKELQKFEILDTQTNENSMVIYGLYGLRPFKDGDPVLSPGEHLLFSLRYKGTSELPKITRVVTSSPKGEDITTEISSASNGSMKGARVPQSIILYPNNPNPLIERTQISFSIPQKMPVSLNIFNILGQRIKTLYSGIPKPGKVTLVWDGTDNTGRRVPSGVYFYELRTPNKIIVKKMNLVD